MPFICSICEEASTQICARCTKDTCGNHLCDKCLRCSDCCECELALEEKTPVPVVRSMTPVVDEAEFAPEAPDEPLPSEPDEGPPLS